ncbi:copper homeostasis protein CutC [Amycolatopsis minnesotensis]|uniref:Copper homeostasis protein cutC homolog n=1 Tax=Amycolatopsis minnesotensis TaxID=337894 RepID=A0ABP5BCG2_9PSEU
MTQGAKATLLEVIALGPRDAEHAEAGGADRLELVTDMASDGLTPPDSVVEAVLAATDLPVRVMLRDGASFRPRDLATLTDTAKRLADAGAREFVFGFLTEDGAIDVGACRALADELAGLKWTFHRAVDHARDVLAAHAALVDLGCDTVLTAGHASGVAAGADLLRKLAVREAGPRVLVGGGLRAEQIPALREAGLDAFHVGSGVRTAGWDEPVDVAAVRRWAALTA